MGITSGKDLGDGRGRHRRSVSIEVARGWLRLGVGSAAVGTALLGTSLWGATPALADTAGGTDSAVTSSAASSDDDGDSATGTHSAASGSDTDADGGSAEAGSADGGSADDDATDDADADEQEADELASDAAGESDVADDITDDVADTEVADTAGADGSVDPEEALGADGLEAESGGSAAESDELDSGVGGLAADSDAEAPDPEPAGEGSTAGDDSTPAGDAAQQPQTAQPAVVRSDTTTESQTAAVSLATTTSKPTTWQQVVARVLDDWTVSHQAWIDSLAVSEATKARLEASFLAMRRTFFNQAPTVEAVQLTGRLSGPITGSLAAVDPDGDVIRYQLARAPREGTLDLAADGSYVYTPHSDFDGVDTFGVIAVDRGLHVNLLDPFRGLGARVNPVINQDAITFKFTYTDGAEHWTDERREALLVAADQLMLYLVVKAPVTLTYEVKGEDDPGSGTLASAGSGLVSGLPGFWPTVVQKKLVAGTDANGSAADGRIQWNFGYAWDLGDVIADDHFDFTSVVLHELVHSLGFITTVGAPGDNPETTRQKYDRFIVTANGTKVIDSRYRWIDAFDANLLGGGGGLYFGGANAVAAYGGPVPLYTPAEWSSGSSMHHLDDETFTGDDEKLMNAATGTGPGARVLSDIEIGILRDLGYHVVPQAPSSATAMLALVVVGFRRRRRGFAERR